MSARAPSPYRERERLARLAVALKRASRFARAPLPALLMLTDETRFQDPLPAAKRLPRGAGIVLRHYGVGGPTRRELALKLKRVCAERGLLLLVAGDAALAREVRADGVHLPEHALLKPVAALRRTFDLVTASAHTAAAIRRAEKAGVDAVLLAPVFATTSHQGSRPLGVRRLARWTMGATLPVYALGGVTAKTAPRLKGTGVAGIAAIGAFYD